MNPACTAETSLKPLLRWAGSKAKILHELEQYWSHEYTRYIEPFAGSAALFCRLNPSKAVLGDLNYELINTYRAIQENPDRVYHAAAKLPVGKEEYYIIRKKNPSRLNNINRAARFIYLNRHCFNGIYRTNQNGDFNVPFGGKKPGHLPGIEHFRVFANRLDKTRLHCADFGRLLSQSREGDFVYMDPPFAVDSRRIFREYGKRHFQQKDLERLANHLQKMDDRGVAFVTSYADCREARKYFSNWETRRIRVRRHIAGFTSARRNSYELIATNTRG